MPFTEEMYNLWAEEWKRQRPNRMPPDKAELDKLMEMFNISESQLFGLDNK